ncbi:hypothetical protein [Pseudaeromonas paramecii]|uniref:Lipoprotein n=1 Tax=Pseudaeromonas paramecii TaxID=2138166 RepID=A0ABP8PWX2_9GAMM
MMKKAILAAALMLHTTAWAGCIGSASLQTCTDNSGNVYTVSRLGNQTIVQGSNANTGNTWNQTSTRMGNVTTTNGYDADGNSWNSTSTRLGNRVYQSGTDSDGNFFQNDYDVDDDY